MRPTRRQVLATTVSTFALAGCAGEGDTTETPGGGQEATDTPTAGATPSPAADETTVPTEAPTQTGTRVEAADETETVTATEADSGLTVQVRSHPDHGEILVDGEGMTLYMFDSDTQGDGASTCSGGCADAWPPLTVEEEPETGDGVTAELTTFEREDGTTQVSANGWPLYYFQSDEEPGDVAGQGVNDVWWVLDPAGEPRREEAAGTETATPTPSGTPTQTPTSTPTPDDDDDGDDDDSVY